MSNKHFAYAGMAEASADDAPDETTEVPVVSTTPIVITVGGVEIEIRAPGGGDPGPTMQIRLPGGGDPGPTSQIRLPGGGDPGPTAQIRAPGGGDPGPTITIRIET